MKELAIYFILLLQFWTDGMLPALAILLGLNTPTLVGILAGKLIIIVGILLMFEDDLDD